MIDFFSFYQKIDVSEENLQLGVTNDGAVHWDKMYKTTKDRVVTDNGENYTLRDEFWIPIYANKQYKGERNLDALKTILAAGIDFAGDSRNHLCSDWVIGKRDDMGVTDIVTTQGYYPDVKSSYEEIGFHTHELSKEEEKYIRDFCSNELGVDVSRKHIFIEINNNGSLIAPTVFEDDYAWSGGLCIFQGGVSVNFEN